MLMKLVFFQIETDGKQDIFDDHGKTPEVMRASCFISPAIRKTQAGYLSFHILHIAPV